MTAVHVADKVWMRKEDAQLGVCIPITVFGSPAWFFAPYDDYETISDRFCVFIDDPHERVPSRQLKRKDFIDLGVL